MTGVKRIIVKYIIAILAILNLIALFVFGYEIPGTNKKAEESKEEVAQSSTGYTSSEKSSQSATDNKSEYVAKGATYSEESAANATTEDDKEENKNQLKKCKVKLLWKGTVIFIYYNFFMKEII